MLTVITEKRPHSVYFPPLEDVARVFKKIKTESSLLSRSSTAPDDSSTLSSDSVNPLTANGTSTEHSLAHCVPERFNPILKLPFRAKDFFCDVDVALSASQRLQLERTISSCPPPKAPLLNSVTNSTNLGAMVPFIYPALPSIKRDLLMVMPDNMVNAPQVGAELYPAMPPLPFPPQNYMPYPLIADKSPLTPNEVFTLWLVALAYLPRVDMVLASAAGSIFDFRAQAQSDGLTVQKLESMLKIESKDSEEELGSNSEIVASPDPVDRHLEDYLAFATKVDTTDEFDPNLKPVSKRFFPLESTTRIRYQEVSQVTVVDGVAQYPTNRPSLEFSPLNLTKKQDYQTPARLFNDASKDSIATQNIKKENKRALVKQYILDIDHEALVHLQDIYNTKKRHLLKRLELLQGSKILYDNTNQVIMDEELRQYVDNRQAQVDADLLQLKIQHTYDKLKVLMSFYQTSHRLYKTMNSVMVNKLKKLKNFLEHQRLVLEEAGSHKNAGEGDITNIRGRESAKLYGSFVEQDYSNEIKEVFRCASLREDGETIEKDIAVEADEYSKVFTNREHEAIVDDYMPLVTENEFKLITGEAPSKTGVSKDVANKTKIPRHLIFQNPLYDYGTSGSDTNLSENPMPVKRRPGRRAAPKPAYGEENTKQLNDAALVAKIMKLFVGPTGANADELTDDLSLIGIKTKWPLK
ncbi:hypothetical protein PUMCH_001043 [Australozyma saopauloensis]|uniref:Uncharacterized protein n=1 Tax=Australozyma saopauloensis TaxID=291208 RepID=A0AAX4H5S1_9ASCO|nr:hypothetical protein PUMCH_001043 [[Candida] saopauloensis]